MAPPEWASPDQKLWLTTRVHTFRGAQNDGTLSAFWTQGYRSWFEQWDKEHLADTKFLDARRKQIRNWFYNEKKPKLGKREKKKKQKRAKRGHEVFSNLYYDKDNLADTVREKLVGQNERRKKTLPIITAVTKDAYANADAEKKEAVRVELKRLEDAAAATEAGKPTPDSYNEAIKALPGVASAFLKEQGDATGWKFRLLAGGPHPSLGGELDSFALDIGKDVNGKHLHQAVNVSSQQEQFLLWLDDAFPLHVRLARALQPGVAPTPPAAAPTTNAPNPVAPSQIPSPQDDGEDDEYTNRRPANALEFGMLYRMGQELAEEFFGGAQTPHAPSSLPAPVPPPPSNSPSAPSSSERPMTLPRFSPEPPTPGTAAPRSSQEPRPGSVPPPPPTNPQVTPGALPPTTNTTAGAIAPRDEAGSADAPGHAEQPGFEGAGSRHATPNRSVSPTPHATIPQNSRTVSPGPPAAQPEPPQGETQGTSFKTSRIRKSVKSRDLTTVSGQVIESGIKRKAGPSNRARKKRKL